MFLLSSYIDFFLPSIKLRFDNRCNLFPIRRIFRLYTQTPKPFLFQPHEPNYWWIIDPRIHQLSRLHELLVLNFALFISTLSSKRLLSDTFFLLLSWDRHLMWNLVLSRTLTGASINPGGLRWSRPPSRFWAGGSWGSQGSRGDRERFVKYYYILSCTGSRLCSKVMTFEEK